MKSRGKTRHDWYWIECSTCKKKFTDDKTCNTCPSCGSPLEVTYDYDYINNRLDRAALKKEPASARKYRAFYPFGPNDEVISLGEGGTAMYESKNLAKKLGLKNLRIKYEGANPTGTFKDRGSMVEISKAKSLGVKGISCASTGNMAASVSAYSMSAKIPCYVFTPQGTPEGKLMQMLAYGGRSIQVRGTYNDAVHVAEGISNSKKFYLGGDYAFRREGQKSISFEITEQLGGKVPDAVVVPMGCGTNITGIWKGFVEYDKLGIVKGKPRMLGVQASGCSPITDAFLGTGKIKGVRVPSTVASAIAAGTPLDGILALHAINDSSGYSCSVTDDEILKAQKLLAREASIIGEPGAAASIAAIPKMLDEGSISKSDDIVAVVTGSGLKDPASLLRILPTPPSCEPTLAEVTKYISYAAYDVEVDTAGDLRVEFSNLPTKGRLEKYLLGTFNLAFKDDDVIYCRKIMLRYLEKGKQITRSDMRLILDEVMKKGKGIDHILQLIDYKTFDSKKGKAIGIVKVNYHKEKIVREGEGVGPVDAIIKAIRGCVQDGMKFRLTEYNVGINSNGTDATVDVTMALADEFENKVISVSTGPDIIEASVEVFIECYNVLYWKWMGSQNKKTAKG